MRKQASSPLAVRPLALCGSASWGSSKWLEPSSSRPENWEYWGNRTNGIYKWNSFSFSYPILVNFMKKPQFMNVGQLNEFTLIVATSYFHLPFLYSLHSVWLLLVALKIVHSGSQHCHMEVIKESPTLCKLQVWSLRWLWSSCLPGLPSRCQPGFQVDAYQASK